MLTQTNPDSYSAYFMKAKKTGSAVVSYKKGKDTYKQKVIVKKYVNPLSSFKIGSMNLTSRFNKKAHYVLSYDKYKNKELKLQIKGKDGWDISTRKINDPKGIELGTWLNDGDTFKVANKNMFLTVFAYPLAEYSGFVMAGFPKEGQSLDDVKGLLLGEIEKIKKGEFSENLLKAVINNKKLQFYNTLESNEGRANMYVDAFINRQKWSDVVGRLDRISKITKQQIVDFANKYFKDNYIAVYKRIGEDTSIKKIDKPHITAIPTNRDLQSAFVTEIVNSKTEPIQPKFVDFNKDLTKGETKKGLPVLYVKNTENGRFMLNYYYKFGETSNKWLPYATEYFNYLGTDKMTAEQLKQKFYELACSYSINVGSRTLQVSISGLAENMTEAMTLMEDFIANAKVDKEAYDKYVGIVEKSRADNKLDQRVNFNRLQQYGMYAWILWPGGCKLPPEVSCRPESCI